MDANPSVAEGEEVDSADVCEGQDSKNGQELKKGRRSFLQQLDKDFCVEPAVPIRPERGACSKKDQAMATCRAYQAANPSLDSVRDPLLYWQSEGKDAFPMLYPLAISMLKFSGGNAMLERLFSYCALVSDDARRRSIDLRSLMMLRCNGYDSGMPVYLPPWK